MGDTCLVVTVYSKDTLPWDLVAASRVVSWDFSWKVWHVFSSLHTIRTNLSAGESSISQISLQSPISVEHTLLWMQSLDNICTGSWSTNNVSVPDIDSHCGQQKTPKRPVLLLNTFNGNDNQNSLFFSFLTFSYSFTVPKLKMLPSSWLFLMIAPPHGEMNKSWDFSAEIWVRVYPRSTNFLLSYKLWGNLHSLINSDSWINSDLG